MRSPSENTGRRLYHYGATNPTKRHRIASVFASTLLVALVAAAGCGGDGGAAGEDGGSTWSGDTGLAAPVGAFAVTWECVEPCVSDSRDTGALVVAISISDDHSVTLCREDGTTSFSAAVAGEDGIHDLNVRELDAAGEVTGERVNVDGQLWGVVGGSIAGEIELERVSDGAVTAWHVTGEPSNDTPCP